MLWIRIPGPHSTNVQPYDSIIIIKYIRIRNFM